MVSPRLRPHMADKINFDQENIVTKAALIRFIPSECFHMADQ